MQSSAGRAEWRPDDIALSPAARERLQLHVVWVTGAGTGFGQAIAVALAGAGARTIISGRRYEKLQETTVLAEGLGVPAGRITSWPMDVCDPAAHDAAQVHLDSVGVTALVHCAALPQRRVPGGPLLASDDLLTLLSSNVAAAWRCLRSLVRAAAPRGLVRGVLLSSEAAWHFTPGFGPYNVSKAALNSLGGSMAEEVAAQYPGCDAQINVLNPGEARTEMNQGSTISPYTAVPMVMALIAQARGGPNGCFFHADGRNLAFASRLPWKEPLLSRPDEPPRLVTSVGGYNVVRYRGRCYGIPQAAGEIFLETCTRLPADVIEGESVEIVVAAVERVVSGGAAGRTVPGGAASS